MGPVHSLLVLLPIPSKPFSCLMSSWLYLNQKQSNIHQNLRKGLLSNPVLVEHCQQPQRAHVCQYPEIYFLKTLFLGCFVRSETIKVVFDKIKLRTKATVSECINKLSAVVVLHSLINTIFLGFQKLHTKY